MDETLMDVALAIDDLNVEAQVWKIRCTVPVWEAVLQALVRRPGSPHLRPRVDMMLVDAEVVVDVTEARQRIHGLIFDARIRATT